MKPLQFALLLATLGGVCFAEADDLGRLFMTPAERALLDQARNAAQTAEIAAPTELDDLEPIILEPELSPERVRVDGYVARAKGRQTVWVNGVDSYQGNLGEIGIDGDRIKLEAPRVRIPVETIPGGVLLKPGQSFDPDSERITDAYERQAKPIGESSSIHD